MLRLDAFNQLFAPASPQRALPAPEVRPGGLTQGQLLVLVRAWRQRPSLRANSRPDWESVLFVFAAAGQDEAGWLAEADPVLWTSAGFDRAPRLAELKVNLARVRARLAGDPAARSLLSVMPAIARSGQLPGSYIDGDFCRPTLRTA